MEKTDSDLNVPFVLHQKCSVFFSMSEVTPARGVLFRGKIVLFAYMEVPFSLVHTHTSVLSYRKLRIRF